MFTRYNHALTAMIKTLPFAYEGNDEWQTVTDHYLWVPGLRFNAKYRDGAEDALKFKELVGQRDSVEIWSSGPDDIYYFPLDQCAVGRLFAVLGVPSSGVTLPTDVERNDIAHVLSLHVPGVKIVTTKKRRQARRYVGADGVEIQIELAEIVTPEIVRSIAFESVVAKSSDGTSTLKSGSLEADTAAIQDLVRNSGLSEPCCVVLNYVQALAFWAVGGKIPV